MSSIASLIMRFCSVALFGMATIHVANAGSNGVTDLTFTTPTVSGDIGLIKLTWSTDAIEGFIDEADLNDLTVEFFDSTGTGLVYSDVVIIAGEVQDVLGNSGSSERSIQDIRFGYDLDTDEFLEIRNLVDVSGTTGPVFQVGSQFTLAGHSYHAAPTAGIDWSTADTVANTVGGYLATLTTRSENAFVNNIRADSVTGEQVNITAFSEIRIGDNDGFGFNAVPGGVGALTGHDGDSADRDSSSALGPTDVLPDLNENGSVATGAGDDFDNRDAESVSIIGGTIGINTAGAQFTDIALSTSYGDNDIYTANIAGSAAAGGSTWSGDIFPGGDKSDTASNQPVFVFDFTVEKGAIDPEASLFFNMVFGDYEVGSASIEFSYADDTNESLAISPHNSGTDDGLIQAATNTLAFSEVFTDAGTYWQGDLIVEFIANTEPYTAFDFVELSTTPISIESSRSEYWVGGYQSGGANPADGWQWLNGEGCIAATYNGISNSCNKIANWLDGEPNDTAVGSSRMTLGVNDESAWNDQSNLDLIGGFLIEYSSRNDLYVWEYNDGSFATGEGVELVSDAEPQPPASDFAAAIEDLRPLLDFFAELGVVNVSVCSSAGANTVCLKLDENGSLFGAPQHTSSNNDVVVPLK